MSIRGLGIDLVRVPRIRHLVDKWDRAFLDRVFTGHELDYCLPKRRRYEHLAGRFAVKESVIKAIGKKIPWKSIEVSSEPNGRPYVTVNSDYRRDISGENISISITHLENYALAIAILEG